MPRHGMSLSVDSAPLTIKRGRTFLKSSAGPLPCMVDNRFIDFHLNGRNPITLFQPAHSIMRAGMLGS